MDTDALVARLSHTAVVPVVTVDRVADAVPLARALLRGGLTAIELTLRTPVALEALAALTADPDLRDMTVGAGTVRNAAQARDCLAAGAEFVVSPGFDPDIAETCTRAEVPLLPGVATSTEIMAAQRAGVATVKFFPAEANGGLRALQALAGPFYDTRFMPTGGITLETSASYLAHPQVFAVGGSWMTPPDAVRDQDWDRIFHLAAVTVRAGAHRVVS